MASRAACQRSSGAGRPLSRASRMPRSSATPAHQPPVGEVLPTATGLPDALLRLVPVVGDPVEHVGDPPPTVVAGGEPVPVPGVDPGYSRRRDLVTVS